MVFDREWWRSPAGRQEKALKPERLQKCIDAFVAGKDIEFLDRGNWIAGKQSLGFYKSVEYRIKMETYSREWWKHQNNTHSLIQQYAAGAEIMRGSDKLGETHAFSHPLSFYRVTKPAFVSLNVPELNLNQRADVEYRGGKIIFTVDIATHRPWTWADRGVIPDQISDRGVNKEVSSITREGLRINGCLVPWKMLLESYTQADGSPCGVEL